jgi:hypothetical protein
VLSAATQCIPVVLALSQTADPQRQLLVSLFADVPSVILHALILRHMFSFA